MGRRKRNRDFLNFIYSHRAIVIIIVIVLVAVLSSLRIYKEEVLNIDTSVQYHNENTLYFAAERIDTLNPLLSNSEDIYYISKLVYESLFDYDENLGIVKNLATDYVVDTEKASIEVTLRNNVVFQNGKKLKAADVCFTVNTIKSIGSKSPYYDKASKIVYCYAKDKETVVFYFKNNYNCSLDDLVFPILPSNQYKSSYEMINNADSFKMIGSGKYMYSSYNSLKRLRLKPNPDYFGTVPDNILIFNIIPDRKMASNMMEIKEVTSYFDADNNRKSTAVNNNYNIVDFPSNNVDFIFFNESGIFRNKNLRKAILYSIDFQRLIDSAYMGDGINTDTLFYPGYYGTKESETPYTFDYNKAKEFYNSAGYYDLSGDNTLKDYSEKQLEVRILVNKDNSLRSAAAKIIKKNLEQIGIKVQLNSLSKDDYKNALSMKDYDIVLSGYSFSEAYDLRELFNGKNGFGYTNSDLFEKVRNLDRLHTIEDYKSIYQNIKIDLLDYAQYYPMCYRYMSMITIDNFEIGQKPVFNRIYNNCFSWYWKTEIETQEDISSEDEITDETETVQSEKQAENAE